MNGTYETPHSPVRWKRLVRRITALLTIVGVTLTHTWVVTVTGVTTRRRAK